MNIYIICPVRNNTEKELSTAKLYALALREAGHRVHFPPDDAPQDDPIGNEICRVHRSAMIAADEVHVFWNVNSKGSHFDLGMAYALGKRVMGVHSYYPDTEGKSYWKAVIEPVAHQAG